MRSVSLLWHNHTGSHLRPPFSFVPVKQNSFSVCLCVEHVGVDSWLSSIVCLVWVWPVTRRQALWPKHAAGGQLELCQPIHGPLPEAVSHLHRPALYLCCQRVSFLSQAHSGSVAVWCCSFSPKTSEGDEILKIQTYFLMPPYWLCPPSGVAGAFRSRKALETFWTDRPSSSPSCWSGTLASLLSTVSFSSIRW